jgi:pimeloyl-ACP methyl ester carboxylesterase
MVDERILGGSGEQRGAGKSTPHACLEENTTWDLVNDIEKIRKHLGIDTWQVNHLLNHDSPVKFKSITS